MWTRKELKKKGKAAMHCNYWKTVLVSLVVAVLIGGSVTGSFSSAAGTGSNMARKESADGAENDSSAEIGNADESTSGNDAGADVQTGQLTEEESIESAAEQFVNFFTEINTIVLFAMFILFFIVLCAFVIALRAFLINPLEAGVSRFFLRNLNTKAEVRELAYCYDHSYINTVKTIFLKDIYTVLWTLLFIIPGLIKTYEYRMMPYILGENPDMAPGEVFDLSKSLMKGNKWKAFVLDLSFIGWDLLSLITLGMVGVFYVNPYRNMTNAALYEKLMYAERPAIEELQNGE